MSNFGRKAAANNTTHGAAVNTSNRKNYAGFSASGSSIKGAGGRATMRNAETVVNILSVETDLEAPETAEDAALEAN